MNAIRASKSTLPKKPSALSLSMLAFEGKVSSIVCTFECEKPIAQASTILDEAAVAKKPIAPQLHSTTITLPIARRLSAA